MKHYSLKYIINLFTHRNILLCRCHRTTGKVLYPVTCNQKHGVISLLKLSFSLHEVNHFICVYIKLSTLYPCIQYVYQLYNQLHFMLYQKSVLQSCRSLVKKPILSVIKSNLLYNFIHLQNVILARYVYWIISE